MPAGLPPPFDLDQRPLVAIFRAPVFNASETFVRAHATGLMRYQPLVIGLKDKGHVPEALAGRVLLRPRLEAVSALAPALVHAHFAPDGLRALRIAEALGVPLVTSLRGYDVSLSNAALLASGRLSWIAYALFQRRLMRRGALFLAVSDSLRRRAIARGFPEARTFTHYNGVDLARFRPGDGGDGATILHVGRLVDKKGGATLLGAFAEVRQTHPRARLVVIGEGPLAGRLGRRAAALGLGDSVSFPGALPPEEVADRMRRAALLAAPSLTARGGDAEGLPNVVVEAAASGLPVVASDHGGIPEAVADGRTGFLVPEGEAKALARRIADLLADAPLRRRMGAAGRALAEEKFDGSRQMRLLEERYDDLRTRSNATETR